MDKHTTAPSLLLYVAAAALFSLSANWVHAQQAETAQPSSIISRDVIVQSGDSLLAIAKRELGSSGYAPMLAEYNEIDISAILSIGQIVRIPIHVPARNEAADVVFVKGTVTGPGQQALSRGDNIELGDIITTGSDGFISIEFSSGTVVNMQPDTQAELKRLNCLSGDDSCLIEIDVSQGALGSDVESRAGQPVEFKINTPYSSAAVRGTVFDFSADPQGMVVGVTEGDVVIVAQDQEVALDTGFGAVTREGEAPGLPIELLPSPVYRYVPARAAPGDDISWWNLAEVNTYEVTLSNDSAGKQAVASLSVNDARVDPAVVPAGDYYLSVRGVDDNALKGFSSSTRLTIAAIDDSLPVVTTSVEKEGNEYLVQVVEPPETAPGFEIQISANEDFSDPLSVDVNNRGNAIFRIDQDVIYTRARILQTPLTVSAFGEPSVSD